ncbi:SRPBCC family protein [Mycobacterium celatum]|uniref:Polyketide cyclase n=1 Tax=Mycobacterium celatum TaxID=28045 RepID=A0A1X1RR89_MYCCE|nr:SRPBCC family protein [Mycobacterium celatum]ORV13615.1 polyketide cyclase [Mycobacterium celatum]PIB73958.1 SRPBCC family protein [Mycobacterium celatum]
MRYRDCPTVEVSERIVGDPAEIWAVITDVTLPARFSTELQKVEWLDGADHVTVGARFRGYSSHPSFGQWHTDCRVVEVEDHTRWVWEVEGDGQASATWGFELDPTRDGAIVRQWARMGPGPSGLSPAIAAMPEKEGRIVARRLAEWEAGIRANLAGIKALFEH